MAKNHRLCCMMRQNEYEMAFENWLCDNHARYVAVDQHKRNIFARNKVKSFDFIIYPSDYGLIIAEIKGRKFKGTSLQGLKGLECWVTIEDIQGLTGWEHIFELDGNGCRAWFIIVYKFDKIDVETDGREVYDFNGNQYIFYAVELNDYKAFMKTRSPKWQTVTLPAAKFRDLAVPLRELLL